MKLALELSDGRILQAEADPAETAEGRALLRRLAAPAALLRAGETSIADVDWAVLQLRADERTVTVAEPDYHADPTAFVPSITLTSRVFAAERRLLRMLGVEGVPAGARQFVRVAADALQAVSVVGVRQADDEAPFSGWQIVPASTMPSADAAHGLYAVHELAALRPAWMAALCLPPAWAFRFAGRCLVDAVAPGGTTHALGILIEV